ncbi:MAG: Aspartate/glutamate/uridylate kinase [Candidatus Moranbacteria bacterium GW2011_GWE1_49_15]|nr:MAG: Aspartate/glutamate/uridylate kinase [Candidatus Moranbacteria bacterium GW2011_GWE2_47_10]KKW07097.1 MAG: Aspartate/glutamate/uridylate kinase [Candidatus Moranbacteria bacterium GW2011_GWE1_49_15]
MEKENLFVISLGGSLIVPEEIDWEFVKSFKELIEKQIKKGKRFIIVTGGGKLARKYIEAGAKIDSIENEDKDWLGLHATRMNAHFIRTVFRKHAHPTINKNPYDLEGFLKAKESILVAAGYKPGNSTDFIAVLIGKQFGAKKIANLSNIDHVCDSDPRTNPDAKKIEEIKWNEFRKIVGDKWDPGANVPFDPVASKLADEEKMEVAIMNGKNLENLEKYLEGEKFEGTVII